MPCWADAMLPDVEAGKRFYGELFGWTFDKETHTEYGIRRAGYREYHYREYLVARSEDRTVAALAPKRDGRMPTVWTVYFATPDLAALTERVRQEGGQLVTGPVPVGTQGMLALVADPEGAVFGLWEGGACAGFEKWRETDSVVWTEVYAREETVVDAFYERVLGFGALDLLDGGAGVRMWSPAGSEPTPDTVIGCRRRVSDVFPAEMPPHFLVHFGVADCEAAVAAVTRLGGRVRVDPFEVPYGRMAVVSDNQGAEFAVLQRTPVVLT